MLLPGSVKDINQREGGVRYDGEEDEASDEYVVGIQGSKVRTYYLFEATFRNLPSTQLKHRWDWSFSDIRLRRDC